MLIDVYTHYIYTYIYIYIYIYIGVHHVRARGEGDRPGAPALPQRVQTRVRISKQSFQQRESGVLTRKESIRYAPDPPPG